MPPYIRFIIMLKSTLPVNLVLSSQSAWFSKKSVHIRWTIACWWKKEDLLTFIQSFHMNWENCACSAENYSNFTIIENGGYVKFPHPRTNQYVKFPRLVASLMINSLRVAPPPPPWGLTLIGAQFTYSPIATPSWISRLTQCIMGDPG
jgi:hypothetical protein